MYNFPTVTKLIQVLINNINNTNTESEKGKSIIAVISLIKMRILFVINKISLYSQWLSTIY